ncbi:MAG: hypothetical protein CMK32_09920 [Porticoccaceae bacterium]|nr:hypothetical protein [Porticoccaceae bacterium]
MSDIQYTNRNAAFIRRLKRDIGRNMDATGDWMVREMAKKMSIPAPPASQPGEYPRKRTGRLVDSIKKTRRGMTMRVGPRVRYAKDLAAMRRKLAPEFLLENRRAIFQRIIGGRSGYRRGS